MSQLSPMLKPKLSFLDLKRMQVQEVMTMMPVTVEEDTDLVTAERLMRENKIRHLPVLQRGKLTGMFSDRDLKIVSLLADHHKMTVADLMTRHPFSVAEKTPLVETLTKMADKKYGCVVVKNEKGEVRGVFTSQDALYLFMRMNQSSDARVSEVNEEDDIDDCLG